MFKRIKAHLSIRRQANRLSGSTKARESLVASQSMTLAVGCLVVPVSLVVIIIFVGLAVEGRFSLPVSLTMGGLALAVVYLVVRTSIGVNRDERRAKIRLAQAEADRKIITSKLQNAAADTGDAAFGVSFADANESPGELSLAETEGDLTLTKGE